MNGMNGLDGENISVKRETAIKQENSQNLNEATPQSGHKRPRSFGADAFTEIEERTIRQKLDVGLSRHDTMQRPGPGGTRLTYVEGWKVIHDANQIFGFNGWSSSIISLDVRYVDEQPGGRYSVCVSACVRVTLRDGSSREDRGGGLAENMRSKGEAIIKAEKEAVTDATKRALKNFGLRLGLSLYDRQHLRDMHRPQPASGQQPMASSRNAAMHAQAQGRAQPQGGQQRQQYQPHQRQASAAVVAAAAAAAAAAKSNAGGGGVNVASSAAMSMGLQGAAAAAAALNGGASNAPGAPQTTSAMERALAEHVTAQRQEGIARERAFQQSRQNSMGNGNMPAVSAASTRNGIAMQAQNVQQSHHQQRTHGLNSSMKPNTANNNRNDVLVSHGLNVGNSAPSGAAPGVGVVPYDGQSSSGTHSRQHSSSYNNNNNTNNTNTNNSLQAASLRLRQQEIEELSAIALADF